MFSWDKEEMLNKECLPCKEVLLKLNNATFLILLLLSVSIYIKILHNKANFLVFFHTVPAFCHYALRAVEVPAITVS